LKQLQLFNSLGAERLDAEQAASAHSIGFLREVSGHRSNYT
jgi:hypothetical protein